MPRRTGKARLPASLRPWDCVILAADSATTSGWAIWLRGRYFSSGEVGLKLGAITDVVSVALGLARREGLLAVLVLEKPFGQKKGRAFGGSGKGRELWQAVWVDQGGAKCRVVQEYPSVWRKWVLPKGMASASRTAVRPVEQQVALSLVLREGVEPVSGGLRLGEDEAPAICMGKWATCAGRVGAVLPARQRRTV